MPRLPGRLPAGKNVVPLYPILALHNALLRHELHFAAEQRAEVFLQALERSHPWRIFVAL